MNGQKSKALRKIARVYTKTQKGASYVSGTLRHPYGSQRHIYQSLKRRMSRGGQ